MQVVIGFFPSSDNKEGMKIQLKIEGHDFFSFFILLLQFYSMQSLLSPMERTVHNPQSHFFNHYSLCPLLHVYLHSLNPSNIHVQSFSS